jgi:hypothetical protein
MHSRRIVEFYEAFHRLDAAALRSAYAPRARFTSPVFNLRGAGEIGALWAMLCEAIDRRRLEHWRIEVSDIEATAKRGRARWEPHYSIRASGRAVHSVIDAEFTFDKEGRIVSHDERFSFWNWSHQALGMQGTLLGWSPLLRLKTRAWLNQSLAAYRQPHQTTLLLAPATTDSFSAL